jgi:hypothetical protein
MTFSICIGTYKVRLKTLLAALAGMLLAVLQFSEVIDWRPILELFFGEQQAAGIAGILSIVFMILRALTNGSLVEKVEE